MTAEQPPLFETNRKGEAQSRIDRILSGEASADSDGVSHLTKLKDSIDQHREDVKQRRAALEKATQASLEEAERKADIVDDQAQTISGDIRLQHIEGRTPPESGRILNARAANMIVQKSAEEAEAARLEQSKEREKQGLDQVASLLRGSKR